MNSARQTVLFVTRKWPPAVGGMEIYSCKLTQALASFARVRTLALPGRGNGSPPSGAALLGFGIASFLRILFQRRAADVVHLGDMALWPLGIAARIRARESRVALSAHGTDVAYHRRGGTRGRAYGAYLRLGARLLDSAKVIANSEATRHVTAETGWRQIEVVPLATDLTAPPPTGEHGCHLLFAGRLVERKGCGWFVRNVLPLLPDAIKLKVAGTRWDADEWQALDAPRVEFLGGLHGSALVDAYRQALCVIVPNIEPKSGEFEGFGLVATEAAAVGGLVLAARTGGLVQAVEDETTGFLVSPGDAPAWAKAIIEVADWESKRRRNFLSRSMERCRDHYSWARVARSTYAAYGIEADAR